MIPPIEDRVGHGAPTDYGRVTGVVGNQHAPCADQFPSARR